MRKEPLALYIFRFLMGFGLLVFMFFLYWSSVLIEQDMKGVQKELEDVGKQLTFIKEDIGRWRGKGVERVSVSDEEVKTTDLSQRVHINDEYPNLLGQDLFYDKTLPKLLGVDFLPRGTMSDATIGKPDNLHPFSNWSTVVEWHSRCSVAVGRSQFGKFETMAPDMGIKMEERKNEKTGAGEFWIHLRDDVFWQPLNPSFLPEDIKLAPQFLKKNPVTAEDFKFYYDAVMNPHNQAPRAVSLRTYFGDIEEIEIIDPYTFVVRWKHKIIDGKPQIQYNARFVTAGLQPLASFLYKYYSDGTKIIEDDQNSNIYRTDSVWAQQFAQHWAKNIIASCGPWNFDGMTERHIQFKRNPDYFSSLMALTEKGVVMFKDTPELIWQDFKANQLATYDLRPKQEIELDNFLESDQYRAQVEEGAAIKRIDYLARVFNYIGWNQTTPYFASKKVRQAMTMAIDRERIIRQNLNGMAIEITGPFLTTSPSYDSSIQPWPYDPSGARMLLEEEGWYDSDGDGIIDKEIDGQRIPFSFRLTYFVKAPVTKAICEYVATALKEIGVACQLNGVDMADLSAAFDDKSFDALCLGWAMGSPPENPRQIWYSAGAKEKGSSNAIGFKNAEADAIIDQLDYESNHKKRIELYHRFHRIIFDEQPYTFLYSPKIAMMYREFVQNVFIPADRQDLIPGANVEEPQSSIFWLKRQ